MVLRKRDIDSECDGTDGASVKRQNRRSTFWRHSVNGIFFHRGKVHVISSAYVRDSVSDPGVNSSNTRNPFDEMRKSPFIQIARNGHGLTDQQTCMPWRGRTPPAGGCPPHPLSKVSDGVLLTTHQANPSTSLLHLTRLPRGQTQVLRSISTVSISTVTRVAMNNAIMSPCT
jgi:hypothetical protein